MESNVSDQTFKVNDLNGNYTVTLSLSPTTTTNPITARIALAVSDHEEKETVVMLTLKEAQNMANALGYLLI